VTESSLLSSAGYLSSSYAAYVRPENLRAAERPREEFRDMTMADVERMAQEMPWGTAAEVKEQILRVAEETGAGTIQVMLNRGAMPHDMFMQQIRRFAAEVLPALQAHKVTRVPLAEEI